mmetsp:Transcript_14635/g.35178  ORF Transcript_14635/g.35178 Transcript_14635/m.35178 type:complete len:994 (-) Transcript_14635:17-2998(-)
MPALESSIEEAASSGISVEISRSSSDEEIQRATAMALAIQNNPNLSPEEIHNLVAEQEAQRQQAQLLASSKGKSGSNKKSLSSRFAAARSFITPGSNQQQYFEDGNDNEVNHNNNNNDLDVKESTDSSSPPAKEKTRRFDGHRIKGAFQSTKNHGEKSPKLSVTTPPPAPADGNHPKSPTRKPASRDSSPKRGGGRSLRRGKPSLRTPPPSPGVSGTTPRSVTSADGAPAMASSVSNSANSGDGNINNTNDATGGSAILKSISSGISSASSTAANALPNLPITLGKPSTNRDKNPIRMSTIAWKRRGGIAKFTSSNCWERRRIELQGSRLYYYSEDLEQVDTTSNDGDAGVGSPAPEGLPTMATNTSREVSEGGTSVASQPAPSNNNNANNSTMNGAVDDVSEGVVVTKQSNWFENTFTSPQEDPNAPRGYLDLKKERAHAHASFGHSGAPSPFAVSIKVRGETKWKLCFDHHQTQMEWLAILTDVVVQSSVDQYNGLLLEQLHPSAEKEAQVSLPPGQNTDTETAGTRLWQLENYSITGNPYDDAMGGTSRDQDLVHFEDGTTRVILPTRQQHEKAQTLAMDACSRLWTVPGQNLFYAGMIVNVALAVARSNALPMEGFWHLLVFTNALLYLCLTKEPNWRSIISHVKATPLVASERTNSNNHRTKSAADNGQSNTDAAPAPDCAPVAGTSTVQLQEPTDPPVNDQGEKFVGWRCPSGSAVKVRSHGYLTTKEKVPSPGELYEVIYCDIFESDRRYERVADRVQLPEVKFDDEGPKTWRCPDLFIMNITFPTTPPKIGRSANDGPGFTIAMYCKMKKDTREILRRVTADGYDPTTEVCDDVQKSKVNAVRLLEEWIRRAPTDEKWFARFKCVPYVHNFTEIGIPGWMSQYNGKPFLVKRPGQTGFIHQYPEKSAFEFTLSFYPFPYLARQAICYLKEHFFTKIHATCCFTVEGRSDDELPECVIGAFQFCYPDPTYAVQDTDFFSGKAKRSF